MEQQKQELTSRENAIQALKFLLFSISAGVVQMVSFTLLNEIAKLPYWISYLVALTLSVLWNFTINRRYTFKSAANVPKAMFLVFLFYLVFTPLSTIGGNACEAAGVNEYIVLAVTMVLNFILEFLFCRFVVYRNSINTNDLARKEKENDKGTGSN